MQRNIEIIHEDGRVVTVQSNDQSHSVLVLTYPNANHYDSTEVVDERKNVDFTISR